jgi:SAM-dependent methyltransferase
MYRRFPDSAAGRVTDAPDDSIQEARESRYRVKCLLEVARSGRLLDIGFGTGAFMRAAREYFEVTGLEIANRLPPDASGGSAIIGDIGRMPFHDATFQAVTSFEVLEHLFETRRFLSEVHRVLTHNGVLLLQTGDASSLLARLHLTGWAYLMPPVHLNVYSRAALERHVENTGLKFERAWSFGRATERAPFVSRLWEPEVARPVLDIVARHGLIGQMYAFRKPLLPERI